MTNQVSSFKLDYRISNYSSHELVVKTQGGLNYIIRKQQHLVAPNKTSRQVCVKLSGVNHDDLWFDKKYTRTNFDKALIAALEEEMEKYKKGNLYITTGNYIQDIFVTVGLTIDLGDEYGIIHSDILGISLFKDIDQANVAPVSSPGFVLERLFEMAQCNNVALPKGGLHYLIYINDPQSRLNPLWTNVMGKAVQVPTVADDSKPGGLYVGLRYSNLEPQELYYTFEELTAKQLDEIGMFSSREACTAGGNTERAISAEKKLANNIKAMDNLISDREKLEEALEKSESNVAKLAEELSQATVDWRLKEQQLKNDHRMELFKEKMSMDILKAQGSVKDLVTKANQDLDKKRSTANNWGEIAKAATALGTLFVGVYKLYTS